MNNEKAHILIVDDELLNLEIISEYLGEHYRISTAEDGIVALDLLEKSPNDFDVIILDRMMPNLNGLDLLKKIKQHAILEHYPVIFQTAKASVSDIAEGMDAGAYYYLTKPFDEEILLSVTKAAVRDRLRFKNIHATLERTNLIMGMLNSAVFEFQTLEEANSIASLVSNACPDPSSIVMGLTELLINAVEHGNLGISYEDKTNLNDNDEWANEVAKRLELPENINKKASIEFIRNDDHIEITVIDQGEGFDWQNYLDFDPNRIMDNHGRGIAIANNISFSSVEYKGKGNEVCARLFLD